MENPQPLPQSQPDAQPSTPSDRDRAVGFLVELERTTPRPFVTWALMAANVAVFVAMVASGLSFTLPKNADLIAWGADYGPLTTNGEWWRMLTSVFVHIGAFHIAMNTFVLYQIGPFIERLVGHVGMIVVYLGAGILGSLASLAYRPENISAGASGAVFGLFGVLLGYLVRHRRTIPVMIVKSLLQNALYFVGYNLLIGFSIPFVDNAAHIGGLLGGCLLGAIIAQPISPEGRRRRVTAAAVTAVVGSALIVVLAESLPRVVDLAVEFDAIVKVNDTTSAIYGDAVDRRARGAMTDVAVAQKIEHDVLPPWRAAKERLAKLPPVAARNQGFARLLGDFVSAKTDAFEFTVRALQAHDESANQEARARSAKAEAILQRLKAARGK